MDSPNISIKPYSRRIVNSSTVEFFVQDILGGQAFRSNAEFISTTTQVLQKLADSLNSIYYASAPEIVPQRSIQALQLGRMQGQYVAVYQETFVLPSECPGKRNKLNIEAFKSGKYQIPAICLWWSNRMVRLSSKQVSLTPTYC